MKLKPAALKKLVRGTFVAHSEEIGCDECWDQIDSFAELTLAGKDPVEALPLLQEHLNRCPECREEYEALLAALQNLPD